MVDPRAYERYLSALLAGDRAACRAVVDGLLARGVAVRALYDDLFKVSLYEVGRRWMLGQVSVAVEHLATAITEDLLARVFPQVVAREPLGRVAVVSCAADEFHQLGGRIVADILELRGWDVCFVGAGTPQADLVALVLERRPDLCALSVTIPAHLDNVRCTVAALRGAGATLPIVVGGQAVTLAPDALRDLDAAHDVYVATSVEALEARLPAWEPAR